VYRACHPLLLIGIGMVSLSALFATVFETAAPPPSTFFVPVQVTANVVSGGTRSELLTTS
jgi:hypothetical protein